MLKWSEKREGDAQRDQRKESEKGRLEKPPWQRVARFTCVPVDQPVFVCLFVCVFVSCCPVLLRPELLFGWAGTNACSAKRLLTIARVIIKQGKLPSMIGHRHPYERTRQWIRLTTQHAWFEQERLWARCAIICCLHSRCCCGNWSIPVKKSIVCSAPPIGIIRRNLLWLNASILRKSTWIISSVRPLKILSACPRQRSN